jgi:hypothetical protein
MVLVRDDPEALARAKIPLLRSRERGNASKMGYNRWQVKPRFLSIYAVFL